MLVSMSLLQLTEIKKSPGFGDGGSFAHPVPKYVYVHVDSPPIGAPSSGGAFAKSGVRPVPGGFGCVVGELTPTVTL